MEKELVSIIEACKQNNRKAQNSLYGWYYNDLMVIARKYKNNTEDACELVNQAFFKILTNIDKYEFSTPFEGWIKRITINVIIDEYRKTKKIKEIQVGNDEDIIFDDTTANLVEQEMDAEEINQLLARLDENERLVFNLYAVDGYAHKEISKLIGISERSSKRYLANAKKNLKQMLTHLFNATIV